MIPHPWRAFRTGLAFALFGLLCILETALVIPVVSRLGGTPDQRERRCQYSVHLCFRLFVWAMRPLRTIEVRVYGAELLRQPGQLVIANHPTLLDVVFLISGMPQADCVVKQEAWSNRFMRAIVTATGYLPNDEGAGLVDACVERLAAGRSLVLFPEGTRSPKGELGPFRRGAIHVALQAGLPMRTVVISCDPPSLMRGQKWYEVPDRNLVVTLDCRETLDPASVLEGGESRGAAARKVSATLRDFYAKKLQTRPS